MPSKTATFFAAVALLLALTASMPAHATVSCDPSYDFIGFSKDWGRAYWITKSGGDCIEGIALTEYDFKGGEKKELCRASADEKENWRTACEGARRKIISEGIVKPQPFLKVDQSGRAQAGRSAISAVDALGKAFDGFATDGFLLYKAGSRSCRFGNPLFSVTDEGSFAAKKVRAAYYNPKLDGWLVITLHCCAAAMAGYTGDNCPTVEGFAFYRMETCR